MSPRCKFVHASSCESTTATQFSIFVGIQYGRRKCTLPLDAVILFEPVAAIAAGGTPSQVAENPQQKQLNHSPS